MKSERFNLRMTPKEKQALLAKAKIAKMLVSQFLLAAAFDKEIEDISNTAPAPMPYIHTDSKQRQRENRKKLAQGASASERAGAGI